MAIFIPVSFIPLQLLDEDGNTLSGGSLKFFLAGTTTPTDLFSDVDGTTSIGVSIVLNSLGSPESGGNTITLFRDQSKAIDVEAFNAAGVKLPWAGYGGAVASFDAAASTKLDGIEAEADVTDTANVTSAGALMRTGGDMTGDITMGAGTSVVGSVSSALTASTTQTQAGALLLTSTINDVSVVANAGDAVRLTDLAIGASQEVYNNGANNLDVYPPTDGTINNGSVNAANTQTLAHNVVYTRVDSINWETKEPGVVLARYGTMYDEDNGDAYVINAASDLHCYHTNGLQDGGSLGWSFDSGGAGTSFPIASIADGVASGIDIEVTTTGANGLAVDDIVSHTNLISAVYTGIFKVKAIISATQYEVAAVFTATDTGTMDQAAVLIAGATSAGSYTLEFSASATEAGSNETFDYKFYLDDTAIVGSSVRRKFGTGGDYGSISAHTPRFTVAAGQKVSFVFSNNATAANITFRNVVIILNKDLV